MQIVKSNRSLLKLSSQLDLTFAKINQQYQSDFYQPLHRLDGLVCTGILKKGIYLLEIIDKLSASFEDVVVHFGVGYVPLTSDGTPNIEKGQMLAKKALDELAHNNDYGNSHLQINLGVKNSFEKMINESLRLCDFIASRWRKSQALLVNYLILNYGYLDTFVQKDVADALEMSPQNFNQQLKNSGYYNIIRMKRELTVVLEQFRRSS